MQTGKTFDVENKGGIPAWAYQRGHTGVGIPAWRAGVSILVWQHWPLARIIEVGKKGCKLGYMVSVD